MAAVVSGRLLGPTLASPAYRIFQLELQSFLLNFVIFLV